MEKPILVVMAAGMGSRYGGLKQIDPIAAHGQLLMDYSLYDARLAGFEEALFIISPGMAEGFPEEIGARLGNHMKVRCAVQDIRDMPEGFAVPEGRVKPWGTAHAVRACRNAVNAPFCVVNADDYYGRSAFAAMYGFLAKEKPASPREYAMVGYILENTLSEQGYVARGVCEADENGHLVGIRERTHIIKSCDGPLCTEDGELYYRLPADAVVSMNLWGFTPDFLGELDTRFARFLAETVPTNPVKAEFFLPDVVGGMLREGAVRVRVLASADRWYGVTYQNDKPIVAEALRGMTARGLYPERLWA